MAEVFYVGVVGAGYVGLATGACLSHLGHRVLCVDEDEERIAGLEEGLIPFYEPGLEELIARSAREDRLSFVAGPDGLAGLVGEMDVVFIVVGTPQAADGSADLSSVGAVARGIGLALSEVGHERAPPRRRQQVHGARGERGLRLEVDPRRARGGRWRGCRLSGGLEPRVSKGG